VSFLVAALPAALLLKEDFSPPGQRLLFASVVGICALAILLLLGLYRERIRAWSNRSTGYVAVLSLLIGLSGLGGYVACLHFCDVRYGEDRVWFPLITSGELKARIDRTKSRYGAIDHYGVGAMHDAIEGSHPLWKVFTTLALLIQINLFVIGCVTAFFVLGVRHGIVSGFPVLAPRRVNVFVSYSHQDRQWLDELQEELKPYIRNRDVTIWDDTHIPPGSIWREEIDKALACAVVAVLLVTPEFLESSFIGEHELPTVLAAAKEQGLRILWIPIKASAYQTTELEKYHAAHSPALPLDGLSDSERRKAWRVICDRIADVIAKFDKQHFLIFTQAANGVGFEE
jgi:hypothetical protein